MKFIVHRFRQGGLIVAFLLLVTCHSSLVTAQEVLTSTPLHNRAYDPAKTLFTLKAGGNQTGNIQEWTNSLGATVSWVDANGNLHIPIAFSSVNVQNLNGIRFADLFPGVDLCARIAAATTDIVNNSGGMGIIVLQSLGSCNGTLVIPAGAVAITLQGENKVGTGIVWNGGVGGTMIDSTAVGNFRLETLTLDGADIAGTAWLPAGGAHQNYFDSVSDVNVQGFTGISFDLAGGNPNHGLSDSAFYNLKITCGTAGTYGLNISLQDLEFSGTTDIQKCAVGMNQAANSKVTFHGGHFSTNGYDFNANASSATFIGTWFENSTNGILGVPFAATLQSALTFINPHFHTFNVASLIDMTGLSGSLIIIGGDVGPASASNLLIAPSTVTDNLIRGVKNLDDSGVSGFSYALERRGLRINTNHAGGVEDTLHIFDAAPAAATPSHYLRGIGGGVEMRDDTFANQEFFWSNNSDFTANRAVVAGVNLRLTAVHFAALVTIAGVQQFCDNCDTPPAPGDNCTSAGDQAGAMAIYVRGAHKCF